MLERCRPVVIEDHRDLLEDADRRLAAVLGERRFAAGVRPDPHDVSLGYVVGGRVTRNSLRRERTALP